MKASAEIRVSEDWENAELRRKMQENNRNEKYMNAQGEEKENYIYRGSEGRRGSRRSRSGRWRCSSSSSSSPLSSDM